MLSNSFWLLSWWYYIVFILGPWPKAGKWERVAEMKPPLTFVTWRVFFVLLLNKTGLHTAVYLQAINTIIFILGIQHMFSRQYHQNKKYKASRSEAMTSMPIPCNTPQCWGTHDDVIKLKYVPRYWPFVWGISQSPMNSPHKGQWRGALMFSLICAWINGWINNHEAGDWRRHCAHYGVTVIFPEMYCTTTSTVYSK